MLSTIIISAELGALVALSAYSVGFIRGRRAAHRSWEGSVRAQISRYRPDNAIERAEGVDHFTVVEAA